MKMGNFKRLFEKDFDESQRGLVSKLALTINGGLESMYLALAKRLTFEDNIQSTIKDIDVQVDATGKPIAKVTFKLDQTGVRATGLIILKATNLTDSQAYVNSSPFISWTQVQTGVQIDNVKGLIPYNFYTIRVLVI
jgi:hypothetical protein